MEWLIHDLIHFEEVEEVIKLRQEEKARDHVTKYVISESLRRNLLYMLEILAGPSHKSFNVVGNYGTGKSHFLAFVAAVLEHPDLRTLIGDEAVRAAAQTLDRRYHVVKFELGAAAEIPLRHIFFDQVQRQLAMRDGIEVRDVSVQTDYDNKQNVLNLLADLKAADPEAGLVVIVDELSDFLKQKSKEAMAYDLALLRELGEVSQDSDFLYIGAMQEHVFTNPKYVDHAESIARINQRFVTVTITKEDVAQVLTQRVVRKDAGQRTQLEALLADYRQYFPNLAQRMERYTDLFPIHPYVIDVFERLPYFENRGIIGFAVSNVKPLLDEPAPRFVTYDRIFDLINATHEIRNQPNVAPVVAAVQTLSAKVELLDADYREDARKMIKALAVLNLLGGEFANGATSQELANTLLITPPRRLLVEPEMARGHIERVMKKIREVTVGQFIAYGEGRYTLDLRIIDDYDAMIEQKARATVNPAEVERAFRAFVAAELGLKEQSPLLAGVSVYTDSAPWPSRRAFRPGVLVIGARDAAATMVQGDYRFVVQGPLPGKPLQRQDAVVLAVDFSEELTAGLTRARAAELLALDNVHRKEMTKLHKDALSAFRERYLAHLLAHGEVVHGGHPTPLSKFPASRPLNALTDVVDHIKGVVLDAVFAAHYPQYPAFRTWLTAANLESEMTRALQSLDRAATQALDLNTRGYLESLGAITVASLDGTQAVHFSAGTSEVCRLILTHVETHDQQGKMTAVEDIVAQLGQKPWGLPREMVYLLLGALLFNGYLIFVQQGGKRLHAGDVGPLLKQGLSCFADIRYLERDKDFDVEGVAALFTVLSLQTGLVRDRDSRPEAVKALRLRGQTLRQAVADLRQGMQSVVAQAADFPEVPWLAVQVRLGALGELDAPLRTFAEASKVADLGKLDTAPAFAATLRERLADLEALTAFLADWRDEKLGAGLLRMQQALAVLPALEPLVTLAEQPTLTLLRQIAADSRVILSDASQLLRSDYRRPLKGKLQQFHQKYDQLYYGLHRRFVGEDAPWAQLAALRETPRYQALARLKGLPFISSAEFTQIALELQALERRRCRQFTAQVLEGFVTCPYCGFPESAGAGLSGLAARLTQWEARLAELWERWQTQLFAELTELTHRLPLLTPAQRAQIEGLQRAGALPEVISDDLLAALHALTRDLQPVDLDLADLGRALLMQGSALTVDELRAGVETYITQQLKNRNPDLVRFRVTVGED